MKRYLFCISFNGFRYSGWQVQKNSITIQKIVQDVFESVVGVRSDVVSCSRTDSGVHAINFYFHVDFKLRMSLNRLQFAINNKLPKDILLKSVVPVKDSFHARHSVKKKEYIYKIWNSNLKNPFLNGLALQYNRKINFEVILKAAKFLIGEHDFSSFCCYKSKAIDKVRTIYDIDVKRKEEMVFFKVVGNGFLYNMVRIIIGTLLEVSEGKFLAEDVKHILQEKNRSLAGRTISAEGLYLSDVIY